MFCLKNVKPKNLVQISKNSKENSKIITKFTFFDYSERFTPIKKISRT
jgi:hypothetical protein